MHKLILLIFLSPLVISCGGNKAIKDYENAQLKIEELASQRFERDHKTIPNSSKRYSIVLSKYKTLKDLLPRVDYFIFDHTSNVIIHEDSLQAGSVKWVSEFEVKATQRGLKTKSEDGSRNKSYTYNCQNKEKIDE